jgi:hypothetical protein
MNNPTMNKPNMNNKSPWKSQPRASSTRPPLTRITLGTHVPTTCVRNNLLRHAHKLKRTKDLALGAPIEYREGRSHDDAAPLRRRSLRLAARTLAGGNSTGDRELVALQNRAQPIKSRNKITQGRDNRTE